MAASRSPASRAVVAVASRRRVSSRLGITAPPPGPSTPESGPRPRRPGRRRCAGPPAGAGRLGELLPGHRPVVVELREVVEGQGPVDQDVDPREGRHRRQLRHQGHRQVALAVGDEGDARLAPGVPAQAPDLVEERLEHPRVVAPALRAVGQEVGEPVVVAGDAHGLVEARVEEPQLHLLAGGGEPADEAERQAPGEDGPGPAHGGAAVHQHQVDPPLVVRLGLPAVVEELALGVLVGEDLVGIGELGGHQVVRVPAPAHPGDPVHREAAGSRGAAGSRRAGAAAPGRSG